MRFMDFCSGIGGGRIGLCEDGMECVAHSEINRDSDFTYKLFFGENEINYGNLNIIDTKKLPDFDLLICGFPCQTFSIAGKRAGFLDERGQVIYGLLRILKEKNTPYFIFENVKGLVNHNRGKTLQTIVDEIKKAGYSLCFKVLDSQNYGVPQMRERIYFVGAKNPDVINNFTWPEPRKSSYGIQYFLSDRDSKILDENNPTFVKYLNNKYNFGIYNLNDILSKEYSVIDWRQSDLRIYNSKCPTLRTGRHGILYVKNSKLHKISGYEALLLQGFPIEYAEKAKKSIISDTKLLSQAGNAMTVNVIRDIGKELITAIGKTQNG